MSWWSVALAVDGPLLGGEVGDARVGEAGAAGALGAAHRLDDAEGLLDLGRALRGEGRGAGAGFAVGDGDRQFEAVLGRVGDLEGALGGVAGAVGRSEGV